MNLRVIQRSCHLLSADWAGVPSDPKEQPRSSWLKVSVDDEVCSVQSHTSILVRIRHQGIARICQRCEFTDLLWRRLWLRLPGRDLGTAWKGMLQLVSKMDIKPQSAPLRLAKARPAT